MRVLCFELVCLLDYRIPMSKVQIPSSPASFLLAGVAAIGLSLLIAACEQGESPSAPAGVAGRFGDAYQVLTNEHPDAPDEPPAINSDTLYVQVSYSGGCEDHEFDLDFETARDTTLLWLHHNGRGDNCEAMIYDRLGFKLPAGALENSTIVLLNPNDDEPFVVRWTTSARDGAHN